MKFIKKIRDDRKGLAIELAMMVMVATFAVSILLTTVALLQVDHSSSNMQDVKRRYELEQIGADYIAWIKAGKKYDEFQVEGLSSVISGFEPLSEENTDTSTSTDDVTDATTGDTNENTSEGSEENKSSESENSDVTPSNAEANDDVSPDDNAPQQGGDANADNAEGSGGDVGGEGDDTTGEPEKKDEETESGPKYVIKSGTYTLTVKDEKDNVVLRVVLEVSKAKKIDNTPGNKVKIITWELN